MTPNSQGIDLTSCDREPIHILGQVQSFGCLIAVSGDWLVLHASENVEDMLGLNLADLIGTSFEAHFPEPVSHLLRGRTQVFQPGVETCRIFGESLFEDGRLFDISIHQMDRGFIYEFEERQQTGSVDYFDLVQTLIGCVRQQSELDGLMEAGARAMRTLTGFDRVKVYSFGDDGSGVVRAESKAPGIDSFLGLRFPASDISKQARALYTKNHLRLIADVDSPTYRIVPTTCPEGRAIDLSSAATRAVSPTHIQYLRNMGVGASMSASIIQDERLWGLFACHHLSPRYIGYEQRSAIELFTQLFNYELAKGLAAEKQDELAQTKAMHDRMMTRVSGGHDLFGDFEAIAHDIHDLIEFDGIAVFSEDRYLSLGAAPTEPEFIRLVRFLNTTTMGAVYATNHLKAAYDQADELADRVAGLLVLPISRSPRDYIVLFRSAVRQSVTWAGSPHKPVEVTDGPARLHPRESFEAWQEEVVDRCEAWGEADLNIANTLRFTLLEVVLKITDEASRASRHLRQKQELLVAELNHRVRNILNLISGIVSQSNRNAPSVESYVSNLEGRIQALARAHDQLTQQHWDTGALKQLIETEVAAYAAPDTQALQIEGPDVQLKPHAYSTLALVLHELVTNSVKHGAFSSKTGRVHVSLSIGRTGALVLLWSEIGGGPVQPSNREGFGTIILERSVPFDLQGQAQLNYNVTGLNARLEVPAIHFEPVNVGEDKLPAPKVAIVRSDTDSDASQNRNPEAGALLSGDVLLVEDDFIAALATQSKLMTLGAHQVHVSSDVAGALRFIGSVALECAVLDVNLGKETSLEAALRLQQEGIPFVIATGYGKDVNALAGYPTVQNLTKPYDLIALRNALEHELVAANASRGDHVSANHRKRSSGP